MWTSCSAESIAGILFEPMLAEGRQLGSTYKFCAKTKNPLRQNDWLLIADEVLVGLGRTGRTWAIEHSNVQPDILVIGKNITGESCQMLWLLGPMLQWGITVPDREALLLEALQVALQD